MNYEVIFEVISVNSDKPMENSDIYWELLLGQIIMNRISKLAYINLLNMKIDMPKVFKKNLKKHCEIDEQKAKIFLSNLCEIVKVFDDAEFNYAFIKGAYLTPEVYELGERTSNDIDVLINKKDLKICKKLLKDNGYIQGRVNEDGVIEEASRKEILFSSMNYGETIPFLKKTSTGVIEIDVNFSLNEGKYDDSHLVEYMLKRRVKVKTKKLQDNFLWTLNETDFLIQLCCHLYKEASNIVWVKYRRDLSMYKFVDILYLLKKWGTYEFCRKFENEVNENHLQKECYYALSAVHEFWPECLNDNVVKMINSIKPNDISYIKKIYDFANKRTYYYTQTRREWFLCNNRIGNLHEGEIDEQV